MKTTVLLFFCFLSIICKSQNHKPIDLRKKDLIGYSFVDENGKKTRLVSDNVVYDKDGDIFTKRWVNYGYDYFVKSFCFVNENDTMLITCACGQERNLYFKGVLFQAGKFEIDISGFSSIQKAKTILNKPDLLNIHITGCYNRHWKSHDEMFYDDVLGNFDFMEIDLSQKGTIRKIR